jgi:hypothetical protein
MFWVAPEIAEMQKEPHRMFILESHGRHLQGFGGFVAVSFIHGDTLMLGESAKICRRRQQYNHWKRSWDEFHNTPDTKNSETNIPPHRLGGGGYLFANGLSYAGLTASA